MFFSGKEGPLVPVRFLQAADVLIGIFLVEAAQELSAGERSELIKKEPMYGRIICRCEQISEGEIVACIRRTCGARTVKGVKKRVRPGMGRCQGGFCEPRVVEILARELGCDPTGIVLDSVDSKILESENR